MNYLLDTHALLWWRLEPARLSPLARATIQDGSNQLYWSAASTWECSVKASMGRLILPDPPAVFFPRVIEEEGLVALPVNHAHAAAVADLPLHHRDPFDRLLIAQAKLEGLALLSCDAIVRLYGVTVLW